MGFHRFIEPREPLGVLFAPVSAPADVTDATRFPNIAAARAELAAMDAVKRARLIAEWEA
ncbi:hypothetical protein GTZ99_12320 [Novosphingobium sp. FSY-8]|uniref:Uncharacterized protein n=1 Tax=Novosphingobium ovatum TaxID=1908523 RepID=A0ABW9XFK4_9SPHN|nr:hypothetical protein [Novosphingobium ovatum]NBC37335.1 hypothetical protein [Novosphingobium ovatum]